MENRPESVSQNLTNLLPVTSRLPGGREFGVAVNHMALVKGIQLPAGSLTAWEEEAAFDIRAGKYELADFIAATKKVIRMKLYNRLDFADVFEEAIEQAKTRKLRDPGNLKLTEGKGAPMPAELKSKLAGIGRPI